MKFSIIIPARDEQDYIGACLASVRRAAEPFPGEVQVIVVINRCTDSTENIAREFGAEIVYNDSKNLSKIRNTGAKAANGEVVLTLDADSRMSPNMLVEIERALKTGEYCGGGVMLRLERLSLGIIATALMFLPLIIWHRTSAGCIWCFRSDFNAIGGFDENRLSFEDIDFVVRLKRHARNQGKHLKFLFRAYIETSCRKFDRLGDWYLVKRPLLLLSLLKGTNPKAADLLWYETKRENLKTRGSNVTRIHPLD